MAIIPNRSYIYMTAVKTSSTKGLNEEVWLEALDTKDQAKILKLAEIGSIKESFNEIKTLFQSGIGIFKERRQPVNNRLKARVSYHSMQEWDSVYEYYVGRGFEVQETEKKETKKITSTERSDYLPMEDKEVQAFIDFLRSYADNLVKTAFTISVKDVSDERIDAAKEILKKLEDGYKTMSVAAFNQYRHKLHQKLPRTIANVRKDDAKSKSQFEDKLKEEIEYFNFFCDQLALARGDEKDASTEKNICESHNISIDVVKDSDEIERIKSLMGTDRSKFSRLFRVRNSVTEQFLENYIKDHGDCQTTELFHGSGTENWWSIITKGLYVNPEALGVSITGKMFGNGIYFAPEAGKSLGYTSLGGSYWKGGSDNTAYLAVFKVATGNPYYIYRSNNGTPRNLSDLKSIAPGTDCLWAEKQDKNPKSHLYRDEVIVYTDGSIREGKKVDMAKTYSQCSIEYLIEVDLSKNSLA